MQRIANDVWRAVLGAPGYAPVATQRGEVGTSYIKQETLQQNPVMRNTW